MSDVPPSPADPPVSSLDPNEPPNEAPGVEDYVPPGRKSPTFPIVGVGASAGGLEAYRQLLNALPADTGMAFVLVQHLAPTHDSMLAEILARESSMDVTVVQDEPDVLPNHVYVIPPNRTMIMTDGSLRLLPRTEARGQHRPIDAFLRSLAEHHTYQAIGVILSGTGNDGTLGLEAIKAEGGITFAQDATAQHDGMPRSAVSSGCVDFVLPPERIAEELARIGRHPYVSPPRAGPPRAPGEEPFPDEAIAKVLRILHEATGVDFRNYKSTTLYRRITRRMLLHKLDGIEEYVRYLQTTPLEVQNLYRDILISVTSFFRDTEAFEALKSRVLPVLLKDRTRSDPLRIWVLGCSTGEEAYSLAITVAEIAQAKGTQIPAQIFATDLNEHGIEKARAGVYAKNISQDVTPERLRRFFVDTEAGYQISKPIRDMCVFARQNVLGDPPFSRMDLVTCRNLLIYMEPSLQRKIIPVFHYALRSPGYLWLGSSETVGTFFDLFGVEDAKHKIYTKKKAVTPIQNIIPVGAPLWEPANRDRPARRSTEASASIDVQKEADRLALACYAPPGVLINSALDVIQFRGDTSPYLAQAPGKPSVNVLKMAREGLLVGLRSALQKASANGTPVRQEGLAVRSDGGWREVNLEIIPLRANAGTSDGASFLILFEPVGASKTPIRELPSTSAQPQPLELLQPTTSVEELERRNQRLTHELAATREYMQSLIEQQEAANEELQSSNEELQSINEELQTSKEEIQSANEELTTVNEELHHRNHQLGEANSDLTNFLASTHLALVMLGPELSIRRFTSHAERILNLKESDVGRSIGDLNLPLSPPDLISKVHEVMDSIQPVEYEVQDRRGRWYSLRLRPYRTIDNRIDGTVLVLVDIDALKQAESEVRASEEKYRRRIDGATGTAIIGLDLEGRVTAWNAGARHIFGYTEPEIAGQNFACLFPEEDRASGRPEQTLATVLREGLTESGHWLVRKSGDRFWANGETVAVRDDSGSPLGFTKFVRDFSDRRRAEDELRESESRFRMLADSAPVLIWVNGRDGCEFVNRAYLEFVGATLDEVVGDCWAEWIHPDDRESYVNAYKEAEARREVFHEKLRFRRADGEYRWMESIGVPRLTPGGEYLGYVGSTHDIHDMTAAAEALQQADLRKDEFLALLGHELRNPLAPLRSTLEAIRISAWNPETARAAWEIMSRQVQRLQRIVDDLLDISSIGQGKFELRREVVDFRETVRQAVEDSRGAFEGRSHMLSVSLSDDPLLVDGDPTRLEQIVVNLLNNAAKYTNSGGKIDVTLTVDQKDVVLAVRDNGIGIAPELLPRVFDLFTQGDRSSTRDRGGLGIGLSLVQKLVAMHGGKVSVESGGRDKGSTFTVRLPSAMNAVSVRPRSKSEKSVTSDARRLRVLVCDDNADAAASLALLLQLQGHEVVTARDGAEALEIAGAFHPEVALLDIGLPQMDGYELAQRMRAQNSHTKPALIALSGYGLEEDRNRSREAGFDAHLTKPVELEVLQEAIADLS